MTTEKKLSIELLSLSRRLLEKEESIDNLQFQLDQVLSSRKWKFISKLSYLYHQIIGFKLDRADFLTATDHDPYTFFKLLNNIDIKVEKNIYKGEIHTHFSVALTAYNEGDNLLDFLKSIQNQSCLPDEIVIVDGGSTDATTEIISDFSSKCNLSIKLIKHERRINIPTGRNEAIINCVNEIIVLCDAGTVLDKNYFLNLVGAYQKYPFCDLVGGIYLPINISTYDNFFIPDWGSIDWKHFLPSTRSMLLKKSLAIRSGLYPEYLQSGDDTLFDINYRKISSQWVFTKEAVIYWDSPSSKKNYIKVARSYGYGDGRSGVGDFMYSHSLEKLKNGKDVGASSVRANFFEGYVEGKNDRSKMEIQNKLIKGVVIIFGKFTLNDNFEYGNFLLAKYLIRHRIKVIYVSLTNRVVPDAFSKYIDVDFSYLELYALKFFDFPGVLKRYRNISSSVFVYLQNSIHSQLELKQLLNKYPSIRSTDSLAMLLYIITMKIPDSDEFQNGYLPYEDCQIPDLGGIYQKFFNNTGKGVFVEVGAFDGDSISNSSFLADAGWKGVYVEPVPTYARMCQKRHKMNDVITLNLAVGDRSGRVKVNIGGDISTTLNDPEKFYSEIGFPEESKKHKGKSIIAEQRTLNYILQNNGIKPNFELLILDTEGTEWNILKSFDIRKWTPKMIIVEMHELSVDWNKSKLIRDSNLKINIFFRKSGYSKVYKDDINTIFYRK